MDIEFDDAKAAANSTKHGLQLALGAVVLENPIGDVMDDRRSLFCLHLKRCAVRSIELCRFARQAARSNAHGYRESHPDLIASTMRESDWDAQDAKTDGDIAHEVASNVNAAPILSDAETAAGIERLIRHRLGISQAEFASRYHVPIGTLRDWEQGRKQPDATALAYLRVIAREPVVVAKALVAA